MNSAKTGTFPLQTASSKT